MSHKECDTPSEHGYACRCDDQGVYPAPRAEVIPVGIGKSGDPIITDEPHRRVYGEGGWIRKGYLAICPECGDVKEGTVGWHLDHERKCEWKPAGTWFTKRLASELEQYDEKELPRLRAVATAARAMRIAIQTGEGYAGAYSDLAKTLNELAGVEP